MYELLVRIGAVVALAIALAVGAAQAGEAKQAGSGAVYSVVELEFRGPAQGPADAPARDIGFWVRFQHESGTPQYKIHGFGDGDGKGGTSGGVFKVRFCPTRPGRWTLAEVHSSAEELQGQNQGHYVTATPSNHPGFWLVDPESPGRRWYMRSDGSHPYITGNTHYSFLSGYEKGDKPSGNRIADDVAGNAQYFKKLRLGLSGDRYPNPEAKPFLDDDGRPTDWGDYSHRPNPAWFHRRVDLAVQTAYDHDLVADLILAGPDTEQSRSTLRASGNRGDPAPFLRYMAARYGSYPNVWICLCNEFDIRVPKFSEEQISQFGRMLRELLPYPTPLSVHATPRKLWSQEFDRLPPWNDHQIIQNKLRDLPAAADVIQQVWENPEGNGPRNKPTVDDELSYQGEGDRHTEGDTIESHLGAFLGGGYGTTGEKPASKEGQYFRGRFDPAEHTAADHLQWLRQAIDAEITFWKMTPDLGIFSNLHPDFRGLAWPGREYVLGTNRPRQGIVAELPDGRWAVTRYDVIARESKTLAASASGRFAFDAPESRAVLFHFQRNP
jgi:hypothetical protein